VAVPILQFFVFRWLWRLISWTLFLRDMARLNLDLVATHPDRAAGLGFLGGAHLSLAIFPFAFSCVLSANVAFQVYFDAVPITSFKLIFVVYLVLMLLLILGPLLIFAPLLARTRRRGMREYSILATRYNRAFHQKWVSGPPPADEPLLGSADIQSLADLGNSFGLIREMKIFPFSQQQILQIAVVACLPGLPLIFLVMPIGEILQLLAGALL
jgi:pimeloyl-ACP methyl ester carboxylesterase